MDDYKEAHDFCKKLGFKPDDWDEGGGYMAEAVARVFQEAAAKHYDVDERNAGAEQLARILLKDKGKGQMSPGPCQELQDELRRLRGIEQSAKEGCTPLEVANMRMLIAEGKAREHQRDLEDAAGELLVKLPLPGTDTAKVIRANRLLTKERDEAWRELVEVKSKYQDLLEKLDAIANEKESFLSTIHKLLTGK